MCHYTIHRMMCDPEGTHLILKPHDRCSGSLYQNERFICPDNPNATAYSAKTLARTTKWTYGPGVCARVACGRRFGLLHRHRSDHDPISYRAYTAPYDLSDDMRREAERRWLSLKTPQERAYITAMNFEAADYKRALLPSHMRHEGFNAENQRHVDFTSALHLFQTMQKLLQPHVPPWWAMNPRYMTAWQLYLYTPLYLDVHIAQPWVERAGPILARHPLMVELERDQVGADEDWRQIVMWCEKVKEKERREEKEKYCWGVEERKDSVAGDTVRKLSPSGWIVGNEDR